MRRSVLAILVLIASCAPDPVRLEDRPALPAAALTCFRTEGFSMLAAHRGGPAPGYPENALSSLHRLSELGVLYAEIDVRRSSDGVLFLLHDDTLDRTTTGTGSVTGQPWSALSDLQLEDNNGQITADRIPTLSEAITLAQTAGLVLNLDLKSVAPEEIVQTIQATNARDHVAIIAYSIQDAAAIHALDAGLVLSVPNDLPGLAAAGVNLETSYIWLGTGPLDADMDATLASRGLETSAGLFRREDGTDTPYLEARATGIELLSIDEVDTAVRALGGAQTLRGQIAACTP